MNVIRPERKSPEVYQFAAQLIMDELGKNPKGYTDDQVLGDIVAALRHSTLYDALQELDFRVWDVTDVVAGIFQRRDTFMAQGYVAATAKWVEDHNIQAQLAVGDERRISMGQYKLSVAIVRIDAPMARYQVKVAGQDEAPENLFYVSFEEMHDLAEPPEAFALRSA